MDNQYRYEAFISYRHHSPDADIAKTLHRQMEQYRIPAALAKQLGKKNLGRIFRDQDELPTSSDLGSDIENALRESKWLIVICSPELLKSKWCMKEVDAFIAMGRRDRILTVLAGGEPSEAFPEQLRFVETDGIITEREPLAADVRAASLPEMKRKLGIEKLRIIAPMLGVGFDDLKQRAREQRLRSLVAASAAVATLVTAFAIYAVTQTRIITQQRNRAVENEMLLWLEKSSLASSTGDKLGGLVYALRAHNASQAISHSQQSRIQDALELGLYSEDFRQVAVIKNKGMRMSQITYSPDGKLLLGIINQNAAALMDAYSGEIRHIVGNNREPLAAVGFSPDSSRFFAYCGWENRITVWDCETGNLLGQYLREEDYAWTVGCAGFLSESDHILLYEDEMLIRWNYLLDQETVMLNMGGRVFLDSGIALDVFGRKVAISSSMAEDLWIYDLLSSEKTVMANPDGNIPYHLLFSPNGKNLTATMGDSVVVWNADDGQIAVRTPIENAASVYNLAVSPDSRLLAYSQEARVVMMDLLSGEVIWTYVDPYPNQVYSLSFSPDGSHLLARHIHAVLLDSTDGHVVHDFAPLETQGAVFSPDGKTILFSLYNGQVSGFTTELGACVHPMDGFSEHLHRVERFNPFPGETPSLVSMHSAGSHIPPGLSRIYSSLDSRFVALTHGDGFIEVWDVSAGEAPAFGIAEHYMMIHDLIFHDSIMLSGSEDGRIMIFDLDLGQLRIAHTLGSPVSRLEISPDGSKAMILHEENMKATVVSTVSGGVLFVLDGKGSPIVDMGFSEDGTQSVIITENDSVWVGQIFTDFTELLQASQIRVQQQ